MAHKKNDPEWFLKALRKHRKPRHTPIDEVVDSDRKDRTRIIKLVSNRKILYPWKTWTDGSWWEVIQGTDYHCSTRSMLQLLQMTAHRRGLRVQSYVLPHHRSIMFQFYKGPKREKLEGGSNYDGSW